MSGFALTGLLAVLTLSGPGGQDASRGGAEVILEEESMAQPQDTLGLPGAVC